MEVKFIFQIIPIPIFYTSFLVKDWAAGQSVGPAIFIKPEHKTDHILQHELVHCRQWYRTFGIHGLLYNISKKYRIKAELEAYKVQVSKQNYSTYIIKWVAKTLVGYYNIGYTREEMEVICFKYYLGE